ncbi:MAG: hypothetical protein ISN28_04405 [Ectothiorhodospiraceae bacterium AqS1]|nr:hypothetical protein [Ectothiorhodospiraceae bacterium AqS1]
MSDARIEHCERRVDSVEGWRSEASGSLDYLRRLAESSEARLTEECRANAEERRANADERRANDARLAEERRANDARLAEERKAYDALLAAERKASRTERYWAMGVYVVLVLGVIGGPIIAKMIS